MNGAANERPARNQDFVQSLARGLAVLETFGEGHSRKTLSEVAQGADLPRGTARRLVLTLVDLGYLRSEGRYFSPTARVLDLGYAYLSRHTMWEPVRPIVADLVANTQESSAIAVLDAHEVVYALRVHTDRILSIRLDAGARLPAYATSTGRMLLAGLAPVDLDVYLKSVPFVRHTPRTVTDPDQLREVLTRVREQGWALVEDELEVGVRSLAVPVRDLSQRTIAAVNVSAHAGRISGDRMLTDVLPPLREAAGAIEAEIFGSVRGSSPGDASRFSSSRARHAVPRRSS